MPHDTFLYGAHVAANGIRQHYLRYFDEAGGGSRRAPLVVLPGITSPAATWEHVGQRLGRTRDTYLLDLRGRGLSSAEDDLDYGLDALADDVIAFAEALGLRRVSVLGHSMGARIAIRAARRGMPAMSTLIAVDPPMSGPGRRPYPAALDGYLQGLAAARRGTTVAALREQHPTWTTRQLRTRAEWLHTCNERAVVASFHGFHADDVHADLPRLTLPALLMTAEHGGVVTDDDVAECRRLLPSLAAVRIAGAGHMIPWDNEDDFHRAVNEFLAAHPAADAPGPVP